MKAIRGCLSINSNLIHKGIKCDIECTRWRGEEETILYTISECPLALKIFYENWIIPKNINLFKFWITFIGECHRSFGIS